MKILIDGRVLAHEHTSGVQRHAQEITKSLEKADGTVTTVIPKYKNRYYQQIWEHTVLPFYARKYDILYCPSNIAPLYLPKKTKLVLTLHDLAFLDFPKQYSSIFQKYYAFLVPKNIHRAKYIITISDFSKKRIIREYPWVENKISVIHHGISSHFSPSNLQKSEYILYVGSMNSIKNFQVLLELFLTPEFKDMNLKMILPYASTFSDDEYIDTLIQNAKASSNINIIDRVNQDELKVYYQKATLFVFPSFHESFGFPPLESMSSGTPVIVSNVTALPEVCKDAALYVDPYSKKDIAEKIKLLFYDTSLQEHYIAKGLAHVKHFRWKKAANAHINIFKKVLKN
ncbi:MAG: glycosyltransferase family 1 protein [Campylobacterota bacterium]|nr:glycosyltransferase family 1 protein [Campylobacterota bacterium]